MHIGSRLFAGENLPKLRAFRLAFECPVRLNEGPSPIWIVNVDMSGKSAAEPPKVVFEAKKEKRLFERCEQWTITANLGGQDFPFAVRVSLSIDEEDREKEAKLIFRNIVDEIAKQAHLWK